MVSLFVAVFIMLYASWIAVAAGILLGHFYPQLGADLKPLGDAFIKLVKMIIAPVTQAVWDVADTLDETARGEGGFGSTGV